MMTTKQIKIADGLSLPMRAVTEMFAFLGRRGSGKTYGASKMAEEMLFHGAQVIVVDPMGVWYGLRMDADGKKPSGIDIPVFGGLRGDLPLTPESGALVADLLVDRRISAILDVSQMIDAEINRFCTAFGDRFFQRMKAKPAPVHVILEECQEFLPQNIMKGEERKLHVYQRIAKQGRSFGIGLSLISQRPQEINKKALNMIEVMFAFQMTGPQERKAIEAWVADKGEDLDIVNLLPKFKVGEPHVWSPQWLKISKQVHISLKRTYDASATPEFGSSEAARELTPVDVATIKEAMHELVEQAEANDPTALKREVARLKKELAISQAEKPAVKEIERVEVPVEVKVPVLSEEQKEQLRYTIQRSQEIIAACNSVLERIAELEQENKPVLEKLKIGIHNSAFRAKRVFNHAAKPVVQRAKEIVGIPAEITNPQQRILDSIAWLESIGLYNPKRTIIAFLAGQSPRSSGFTNNLGALRSIGLITYPSSDSMAFTDAGRAVATPQETVATTEELQDAVLSRLPRPQARILEILIDRYPKPVNREELAEQAGQSPRSSGYTNNLGALRSLGVIDYPNSTEAIALPVLFLE